MTESPRWPPIVTALVAVLVYANAVANGFVLDDRGIILQNPLVQEPWTSWRAFVSPYWPPEVGGGQYRPLGILSFALDRALAGDSAAWYHLVNVGWHAAATVLLTVLGLQLGGVAVGVVAGLLFAVHPVHVEAVANTVGRLELMAATFGLATLLLHRRRSAWAGLTFAAALLSKESAIVVPMLALLVDRIPGAAPRRWQPLGVGYAAVVVTWGAMMAYALRDSSLSTTTAVFVGLSPMARLLTVLSIVPHYARLLLVPAQLSADYEPGVLAAATTVTPMVVVGLLVVVLVALALRLTWRRVPLLAVALAWSAIALAPVSNVLVVTGVALAERTLYLASAGVTIGIAWLVTRAAVSTPLVWGLAGLLLVAGALRTWTRTPVWRDSRTLALQLVEDHPESYRGHWVAARVLRAAGDLPAAAREYAVAHSIYAGDVAMLHEATEVARSLGDAQGATRFRAIADSVTIARAR
jgi:protein O-mannosyl-transferase